MAQKERLLFLLKINLMYEMAHFISRILNNQYGWLFFLHDIDKVHLFWHEADSEQSAYARGWWIWLVLGCFHVSTFSFFDLVEPWLISGEQGTMEIG